MQPAYPSNNRNIPTLIMLSSIGVYLISLVQQSYCTERLCRGGIDALIGGVFIFWGGGSAIAWLANPLLLISWTYIYRRRNFSLISGVMALLLALSFMLFSEALDDEGGHTSRIISYHTGYWLWIISMLIILIGNMYLLITAKRST